jgi:hypothetical protein
MIPAVNSRDLDAVKANSGTIYVHQSCYQGPFVLNQELFLHYIADKSLLFTAGIIFP